MKNITPEMAQAAAEWWANRLRQPKFDSSHIPTEDQLNLFREALRGRLLSPEPIYSSSLYVDYGPDSILTACANAAGISLSRFPCKTGTWFRENVVEAACGYGAPHEIIYPKGLLTLNWL